mmetsp:Transcript_28494/g.40201  ORF Transcript_28494/g.40201 Transcript_28494/m.40201 type:complete len:110 (-) Transcript_28494:315-644(-)
MYENIYRCSSDGSQVQKVRCDDNQCTTNCQVLQSWPVGQCELFETGKGSLYQKKEREECWKVRQLLFLALKKNSNKYQKRYLSKRSFQKYLTLFDKTLHQNEVISWKFY